MAAPIRNMILCNKCLSKRLMLITSSLRHLSKFKRVKKEHHDYWKPVIGLEIHSQILSNSKLFSGAGTKFSTPTNTQVAYFDAALPGTLPVINRRCVEAAVLTALALNCKINMVSKFDRKHYFYADLPAGYQITQQRIPIAVSGHLDYIVHNRSSKEKPQNKTANIVQIQIEQDSGKSLHDYEEGRSLIDLNRAGMGLMEIVTAPDFGTAEEASSFVNELQLLLKTLGTCDGIMAEGSLRVDANVSVHAPGEPLKGIRAEVKNINSFRFVRKAIEYEIERQINERENGRDIVKETRSFDFTTGTTVAMRDKESQIEYRFMPEPNLPPLQLCDNSNPTPGLINIDQLRSGLPLLPSQMRQDLSDNHGVPVEYANEFVKDGLYDYVKQVVSLPGVHPGVAASSVLSQLLNWLREDRKDASDCLITAKQLAGLSLQVQNQQLSKHIIQKVLRLMYEGDGRQPGEIVDENDWSIINDSVFLADVCRRVMEENPKAVSKYRKGKKRILNLFIGEIHKATHRRAEETLVAQVAHKTLMEGE